MNVNAIKDGTKLTITAEGKLGTTSAPKLEKALKSNIDGVTELVFDLAGLEYMASAGLRVLLSAARVMRKQGRMKIINVSEPVMEVFTFTGMADAFDIEE
jgi:anti-sigma B factor antagonist